MGDRSDKTETRKLGLIKGGRKRDIYDDAKWKKRPIDMDGGQYSGIPSYDPADEQSQEEDLRSSAQKVIEEITADPVERRIGELMLENYEKDEIAEMLNISPARVEWFLRKIEGWKRKKGSGKNGWIIFRDP